MHCSIKMNSTSYTVCHVISIFKLVLYPLILQIIVGSYDSLATKCVWYNIYLN